MESSLGQTLAAAALAPAAWLQELAGLRTALGASMKDPAVRSLAAMWLVAAAVVGLDLVWAHSAGLQIVGLPMIADGLRAGLGMAILCRAFQHFGERLGYDLTADFFRRAARLFHAVSLAVVLSCGFVVLSYLAVAARMPTIDATLSRADATIGFDWLDWFNFVQRHFWLRDSFPYIYNSIQCVFPTTLIYLTLANRNPRPYHEMIWIYITTVATTIAVCGFFPALHAPAYFALKNHDPIPNHLYPFLPTLFALRARQMTAIDLSHLTGVVCFPSFHTVMIITFCYVLRRTRLFWLALALGGATILTLPSVGGHYLVDILGGAIVALTVIVLVRRWLPVPAVPRAASAIAGADAERGLG